MTEVLTYEALKAERDAQQKRADALAVENQALKDVVGECQAYFIAGIRNTIRPVNEGYLLMRCDTVDDETPATDAALAAIEARGVEKFADMCREKSKLATTADSCAGWSNCSVHASSFAIRLREAK
ncbi:TPA: hypothetical protein ACGD48_002051 [Serratia marcescens]